MRNTLLLLSLLLPVSLLAQKTKKVIVNSKGSWEKETYYVLHDNPEVKHGPYTKEWGNALNMKPVLTGFYKQGQRDSIWTEYDWSNKPTGVGNYRQDQKSGVWKYYSSGDTLIQQYDYTTRQLQYALVTPAKQAKKYTVVRGSETQEVLLERPAMYLGGPTSMTRTIITSIKYPALALRAQVDGKVWIEFLVDEQGHASGHRVKKGIGFGCDEEALRVVKLIPDNWLPAILNNEPVATMTEVPITFSIR